MLSSIYDHDCKLCPLHQTVPQHEWICVEGSGDYELRAMILGEAPGAQEAASGIPFVGRAGEVLDLALQMAGTRRKDIFVTNTVKCRPPDNRKPSEDEERSCRTYLLREIDIVDPIAILALGNHALRASTGLWGITRYAGIWQSVPRRNKEDLLVLPCYHPAYILRNRNLLHKFQEIVAEWAARLSPN